MSAPSRPPRRSAPATVVAAVGAATDNTSAADATPVMAAMPTHGAPNTWRAAQDRQHAQGDLAALLHLLACPGRRASLRALLDAHGSADAVLAAGRTAWQAAGLDHAQCAALAAPANATELARVQAWCNAGAGRHRVLGWHHADFPPRLREAPHPPLAVFVAGDPVLLWRPMLAIVGSRAPTAGGREHARRFARELAEAGWLIASGLAEGIDAEAHRAALAAGEPTVAVIGTGPDRCYPRHHRALHAAISAQGVLLSEYPPGTLARVTHFPERNRLIAALAVGTLVVEAAERSGALITARLAAEAGREAFALPGSIDNPLARGCHRLLREGAGLVETAAELHALLAPRAARDAGLDARRLAAVSPASASAVLAVNAAVGGTSLPGTDPNILWQALGHDPTGMDTLVARTGLTAPVLSAMLLTLELDGRVVSAHGRYQRRGS